MRLKSAPPQTRTSRWPFPCDVTQPVPPHPATAQGVPLAAHAGQATTRHGSTGWRRWLARALHVWLAFTVLAPRAWDADAMLRAAQAQGPQALVGARALQTVLGGLAGQDEDAKLAAINQFFNRRIVFASDLEVWGQNDHWASPIETLAKGRGDCEDYVIAKYFGLLAAGVPVAKLRLVYVRAMLGGPGGELLAHMVLAYYVTPGAEPLILDNLIAEMRPASRRPDLAPVFSFNGEGLWQGVGAQAAGDPATRLSRWREVLAKARTEGFE
jgi:predicted transglutaminase-like cysteine proteinase